MTEITFTIPTDFSTLTGDQLNELAAQAKTAAAPLVARVNKGESLEDAELATLERLGQVVTQVAAVRDERVAQAANETAAAARQADAAAVFGNDGETPADEDEDGEDEPAKKKAPKKDEPEEKGVQASGAKRPGVGQIAKHVRRVPVEGGEPVERASFTRAVAAAGQANFAAGAELATIDDIAAALEASFANYGNPGKNAYIKSPVVQFQRNYPAEQRITAGDDPFTAMAKFEAAATQGNLPGGSLVAAAGWCAPSEILYDLFELENGTAGILDLPEVQISRGGIQFSPGPDFSAIWGGTGYFHQTEAQVIAATTKPCMVVPCPTFQEKRLEVEGVCVTGAFLQDRGYPEMVARFTRGVMVAHRRKLNAFKIAQVVAGSTLVNYDATALVALSVETDDHSLASRLMWIVETQITDYRYKHRMADDAMLEVLLPAWLRLVIRADVQRRTGTSAEQAFEITNQMIDGWLRMRGARVQWLMDWQDAYSGGSATLSFGGTTLTRTPPRTVDMVIYAAGTFVAGVADVIRLDTVYDSTNLALNQYTQLFTEEGILVAKRGFESRLVRFGFQPSGVTSAAVTMIDGA
jgi:hypothetical protein